MTDPPDSRRPSIGEDFGFSPELAAFYMREDLWWETDVARFGIDIWMTPCAINEGYQVVQTDLGTNVHDAKDPVDLGPMFRQVVSTLFYFMGKYERHWHQDNPFQVIQVNKGKKEEPR